jgi:hypothetical protein
MYAVTLDLNILKNSWYPIGAMILLDYGHDREKTSSELWGDLAVSNRLNLTRFFSFRKCSRLLLWSQHPIPDITLKFQPDYSW